MIAANEIARIPGAEMMALLRDMGAVACRTTMPDIDHVGAIVRVSDDETVVMSGNHLGSCSVTQRRVPEDERANEPLDLPIGTAAALVRGEPRAYDRVRSVLRAPFN